MKDLRSPKYNLRGDMEDLFDDMKDLRSPKYNLRGDMEDLFDDMKDLRSPKYNLRGDMKDQKGLLGYHFGHLKGFGGDDIEVEIKNQFLPLLLEYL